MSLKEQIFADLKQAMKSGDAVKRDTLRMLDAMIKNIEIEKKKRETGLSDDEVREAVARCVKQRRDAIEQYEAGGRGELADKEKAEIEILMKYMPSQLAEAEVRQAIDKIIAETGAASKADMGRVMGAAMAALKGKAEGSLVKKIVDEKLK